MAEQRVLARPMARMVDARMAERAQAWKVQLEGVRRLAAHDLERLQALQSAETERVRRAAAHDLARLQQKRERAPGCSEHHHWCPEHHRGKNRDLLC